MLRRKHNYQQWQCDQLISCTHIKEIQHAADTSAVLQDENFGPKHLLQINHMHQQMRTVGLQTLHKSSISHTRFGANALSCLNSFVSETSWGLCLGAEACIRTLCTVCNPVQCIFCRMWLIIRIMNMMCNIKPVGKMLAFSDHRRHGDLNLDQFLVFMVTLHDRNIYYRF